MLFVLSFLAWRLSKLSWMEVGLHSRVRVPSSNFWLSYCQRCGALMFVIRVCIRSDHLTCMWTLSVVRYFTVHKVSFVLVCHTVVFEQSHCQVAINMVWHCECDSCINSFIQLEQPPINTAFSVLLPEQWCTRLASILFTALCYFGVSVCGDGLVILDHLYCLQSVFICDLHLMSQQPHWKCQCVVACFRIASYVWYLP